jgi:hypothetical protein
MRAGKEFEHRDQLPLIWRECADIIIGLEAV